jgi:hypothetical protein
MASPVKTAECTQQLEFYFIHSALRVQPALRDYFLRTLWDTDATDFVAMAPRAALSFTEKTVRKRLLSVVSVKSVYKKTATTT